jgi:uncharacterized protein (DUF952 family)
VSVAFKVVTAVEHAAWASQGSFAGSAADAADGFIHLSTPAQLPGTLLRHFAGQADLVAVAVELDGLPVRWEPARGGELFPHVYGALPYGCVREVTPLPPAGGG